MLNSDYMLVILSLDHNLHNYCTPTHAHIVWWFEEASGTDVKTAQGSLLTSDAVWAGVRQASTAGEWERQTARWAADGQECALQGQCCFVSWVYSFEIVNSHRFLFVHARFPSQFRKTCMIAQFRTNMHKVPLGTGMQGPQFLAAKTVALTDECALKWKVLSYCNPVFCLLQCTTLLYQFVLWENFHDLLPSMMG